MHRLALVRGRSELMKVPEIGTIGNGSKVEIGNQPKFSEIRIPKTSALISRI